MTETDAAKDEILRLYKVAFKDALRQVKAALDQGQDYRGPFFGKGGSMWGRAGVAIQIEVPLDQGQRTELDP